MQCWVLLSLCQHDLYLAQSSRFREGQPFSFSIPEKWQCNTLGEGATGLLAHILALDISNWVYFQPSYSSLHYSKSFFFPFLLHTCPCFMFLSWCFNRQVLTFQSATLGCTVAHVMWQAGIHFLFFLSVPFIPGYLLVVYLTLYHLCYRIIHFFS